MRYIAVFPGLLILAILPFSAAQALESPWRSADHLQARLISGTDTAGSADHIDAMLEVRLEDGWHAYWRMAGDGGLAPSFDWKDSGNAGDVVMDWQTPLRFEIAGLQSFGYAGSFTLPVTVKIKTPGQPVTLSVKAEIMACKDICVPQSLALELSIPAGNGGASPDAALVGKARVAAPVKGDTPALKIESTVVGPEALVVQAWAAHGFEGADLFAEPAELVLYAKPQITPDPKDPRRVTLRIPRNDAVANLAKAVMGKTLVLTLTGKDGAIEKSIPF